MARQDVTLHGAAFGASITPSAIVGTTTIPVPVMTIDSSVGPSAIAATSTIPTPAMHVGSSVVASAIQGTTFIRTPAVQIPYTPPTPSASIQPGVDYDVGVEPFTNTGTTLVTITPNMAVPGTSLTSDSTGNINVTVANTTLRGLYLPTGAIFVKAANCWIDKCLAEGSNIANNTGSTFALFDGNNSGASNMLVTDSTARPAHPNGVWDGYRGWSLTLKRCKAEYTTDCLGVYRNVVNGATGKKDLPVTILVDGCDFNNMTYVSPDATHTGSPSATHNDCIQVQSAGPGSSIEVRFSTLFGYLNSTRDDAVTRSSANPNAQGGYNVHYPYLHSNSGFQITQDVGPVEGFNIHHNWGGGGAQWWNTKYPPAYTGNWGTIASNKVNKDRRPGIAVSQTINVPTSCVGTTFTPNNTFIEDGTTITVNRF